MSEFAPMLEGEYSRASTREIIKEVWDLAGIRNDVFLDCLGPKSYHTTDRLNARLQELVETYQNYHSVNLMAYLRNASQWQHSMPAWYELRDLAYKQTVERNSEEFAKQIFMGMFSD